MKKTIAILLASSAIAAAIGLPAWATLRGTDVTTPVAAVFQKAQEAMPLIFVSDDDGEDDDDHRYRRNSRGEDDDGKYRRSGHDDDDYDDDDDDDDDYGRGNGMGNPAPAGTVAPPQNGLFGDGAAPKVQLK